MAEMTPPGTPPVTPKKRKTGNTATLTTAKKPRKTVAQKGAAKETVAMTDTLNTTTPGTAANPNAAGTATGHRAEAKSRFNAALEEAKAGAAALKAEAGERAGQYRTQAKGKSRDWATEARTYGGEAKVKGKELATEGKLKASEGIRSLGQTVAENAHVVDEKLGAKYGDYARSASRTLSETADKLDQKSVDELGEDAREFVRKSPGLAVGMAAVAGFFLSRLFRGSR